MPQPSAPLHALWAARSVAIIGASDSPGALGRLPVEFLVRYGYEGAIYPVRPDHQPVCGLPSYSSLAHCPGPVELAMIMVGATSVSGAIADCVAAGVQVAIVCTSGFAETGEAGAAMQHEIVATARAGGMRVLGPNCIGTLGVGSGQVTSFSPLFASPNTELVPGTVGFVSQSGALGYGAVSLAFERGLGLGWVVNTGNEADVSAVEVMAAMAQMAQCTGVIGYVETLTDMASLRDLAGLGKPVAILKAGRSEAGSQAAASHTGSLAVADRVVDAALRQLGIVRADDIEALLDIGSVMGVARPAGRRVAVVTTSGGSGILAADAIEAHGLQLATLDPATTDALDEIVPAFGSTANPVDVTASVMSDSALFERTLSVLAADPNVDAIVACFCVLTGRDVDDVVAALSKVAGLKPVIAVRTGADQLAPLARAQMQAAGIASFPTPARAVTALAALCAFSGVKAPEGGNAADPLPAPQPGASEAEMKALLASAGLPVPRGQFVATRDEAEAACVSSSVFKAVVPGLLHKSEAGGVIVGVEREEAGAAFDQIAALGGQVWVEECVPAGVEVLVGIAPSPLGQVLTVGVGGVLTEVVADVALRVLPVDAAEVDRMLDETRVGMLLGGVRGAAPADRQALVHCIARLAEVTREWPAGFELDLNPVTALPTGVRILDAAYVAGGN